MFRLMEGSTLHYSMNKSVSPDGVEGGRPLSAGEESGWTSYFEDFMESQKRRKMEEEGSSCIAKVFSFPPPPPPPPPISDAGSCTTLQPDVEERLFKKLIRFKKRKKIGGVLISVGDDSLEDTASSPFTTPKVSRTLTSNKLELRRKEMSRGVELVDHIHENLELKRKGLCLVPVSLLVEYYLG